MGAYSTELGIFSSIILGRGTIHDLRTVTAYITHKILDPRENGTLYQQKKSDINRIKKTPLRVYNEDLLKKNCGQKP